MLYEDSYYAKPGEFLNYRKAFEKFIAFVDVKKPQISIENSFNLIGSNDNKQLIENGCQFIKNKSDDKWSLKFTSKFLDEFYVKRRKHNDELYQMLNLVMGQIELACKTLLKN